MKYAPIKPSLASLIRAHRQAQNWTPENDGEDHRIADDIRVALMADCDLSKPDADYLMETVL